MKSRLVPLAGALLLVLVLGHFYAKPLVAQVRAALIQDVDNAARHPYTQQVIGVCSTVGCSIGFPAVPSGKRLVIEQVNVVVSPASPSTLVGVALLSSDSEPKAVLQGSFLFPFTLTLPVGPSNTRNSFVGNLPVVAYYEAGSFPSVQVYYSTIGSPNDSSNVTISGHLIDLP